ncbi:hypothetical protein [Rhodobacter lacus]|uniref:Uncharacterized protein n=1 Tax=Rhodobacter lacus TaxID=1641972 RepID=A0ABW5AAR1_9RHOB
MPHVLPIHADLRPAPLLPLQFVSPLRTAEAYGVLPPPSEGGACGPARPSWLSDPETDWPPGAGFAVVLIAALVFWAAVLGWLLA